MSALEAVMMTLLAVGWILLLAVYARLGQWVKDSANDQQRIAELETKVSMLTGATDKEVTDIKTAFIGLNNMVNIRIAELAEKINDRDY